MLACPDPRRELETIAAEIWRLVRESDGAPAPLRFNEIAVLVPGREAAARLAMASAVFREASDLPHSVADLPLPADSRVAEAVDLLLALPLGNLIRQDLLRLLMHPAVAGAGVDAGEWLRLCDDLGIVHGGDRQDHAGTYIDCGGWRWGPGSRGRAAATRASFAVVTTAICPRSCRPTPRGAPRALACWRGRCWATRARRGRRA